jgi:hypothetical protein
MGELMKIFLSHKLIDDVFVRAIEKAFTDSDPDHVIVVVSPSAKHAGEDFKERIWAELRDSDCVILLYTDESLQWDWPLYECGFYHGHHHRVHNAVRPSNHTEAFDGRRLFIIHRKDMKEDIRKHLAPLENWESIAVETDAIPAVDLSNLTPLQTFLERMFFKKSFGIAEPILRQVGTPKADELARLSEPLIAALRGRAHLPEKKAPLFAIEIPGNASWPEDGDLPEGAMISSQDRWALETLGVDPQGNAGGIRRAPWASVRTQLEKRLQNAWPYWRRTLADTLHGICQERHVDSALPLLRKDKDELGAWRPVLDDVSQKRDGTWVFTILLADVATAIERMPKDELGSITRLLWMERMFICGIVEEYATRFAELKDRGEVGDKKAWIGLIAEFRRALDMVYAEAMNMGYDRADVRKALTRPQRTTYQNTITEWEDFQPRIDAFTKERDPQRSWELCYDLFNDMQRMSSNLYRIAGKRLATLTAKIPQSFFHEGDNGQDGSLGNPAPHSPAAPPMH